MFVSLNTVEENEFYGFKIIICMLWLVKQSTLTWLLFRFYVVEQRYLNYHLLSYHRVMKSQPQSAGEIFQIL